MGIYFGSFEQFCKIPSYKAQIKTSVLMISLGNIWIIFITEVGITCKLPVIECDFRVIF